jgi:hypothetical protein
MLDRRNKFLLERENSRTNDNNDSKPVVADVKANEAAVTETESKQKKENLPESDQPVDSMNKIEEKDDIAIEIVKKESNDDIPDLEEIDELIEVKINTSSKTNSSIFSNSCGDIEAGLTLINQFKINFFINFNSFI